METKQKIFEPIVIEDETALEESQEPGGQGFLSYGVIVSMTPTAKLKAWLENYKILCKQIQAELDRRKLEKRDIRNDRDKSGYSYSPGSSDFLLWPFSGLNPNAPHNQKDYGGYARRRNRIIENSTNGNERIGDHQRDAKTSSRRSAGRTLKTLAQLNLSDKAALEMVIKLVAERKLKL